MPLPETTFTYGDYMHLTAAKNGYGGEVDFSYTAWHDVDASTDATTDAHAAYVYFNNCANADLPWMGFHPVFHPGGSYRLHANYVPPANNQIQFQLNDGVSTWVGQILAFTSSSDPIWDYLPAGANATQIQPILCNLSGNTNPLKITLEIKSLADLLPGGNQDHCTRLRRAIPGLYILVWKHGYER